MALSLEKGQIISLLKEEFDLSSVTIGLGWDVMQSKKGLLGTLFGKTDEDYDLDAIAFLLDGRGKVRDLGVNAQGNVTLDRSDVVYYNNLQHPSGAIWLTGDNQTGEGEGDDEQIIVRLNDLPAHYESIVFVVSIYQGKQKGQNFGQVENAFIRAVDAHGKEICRYALSGSTSLSQHCSMTFATMLRNSRGWEFKAIGTPHETDRFIDVLRDYI